MTMTFISSEKKDMPSIYQTGINSEFSVQPFCNPIVNTLGPATLAGVGSAILPTVGYASIAAAAGTIAAVASAAAGGAFLLIPHYILARSIANNLAHRPILHGCLQTALFITNALCAGLLGAAFLGIVVNPVGLCVLAGSITFALAAAALCALIEIMSPTSLTCILASKKNSSTRVQVVSTLPVFLKTNYPMFLKTNYPMFLQTMDTKETAIIPDYPYPPLNLTVGPNAPTSCTEDLIDIDETVNLKS